MFKRRPIIEYKFFIEAWLSLAISSCLIAIKPFHKLLPLLGQAIQEPDAKRETTKKGTPDELLRLIQISILRASRKSPWRTLCFEQALAARMMLRKRKYKSVIYFGLIKNFNDQDRKLRAHAWLICSGFNVTGGKNNEEYAIVGRFFV